MSRYSIWTTASCHDRRCGVGTELRLPWKSSCNSHLLFLVPFFFLRRSRFLSDVVLLLWQVPPLMVLLVQGCWGKFFHLWMSETVFILPSFFKKIYSLGKESWVVRFYVSPPFSMMLHWLLVGTVRLGFSHVMTGRLGPMHREARFLSTAGKPLVLS